MTPILICSNIVLTKKVGFDSGKLFFPIIIQTKSRDLYSKASVVTRKRNTYNILGYTPQLVFPSYSLLKSLTLRA